MPIPYRDDKLTRRTLLGLTTALLAMTMLPLQPALASSPHEKHVEAVANNVISLANSGRRGAALHKDVAALLNRNSDIGGIARFALGRYRKKLPKRLKSKYNRAILNYVAGLFVYYADDFVGSGVKIKSSHKNGRFVLVDSAVSMAKGGNTKLRWRLRARGNYRKIADINFRGIWLSLRLRDEIASVLKKNKGDFSALIAHLEANS